VLLTAGLVAVLFGIIEGTTYGWTSAPVLGAFATGAVLTALFTAHALRSPRPLVGPRVFASARLRSPSALLVLAATALVVAGHGGCTPTRTIASDPQRVLSRSTDV
jgi:Co/Zn/Cd efflux system component